MRSAIISKLNPDFVAISESHCKDNFDNQPCVDGYTWIGHCRPFQHRQSTRQFGGVGLLFKTELTSVFEYSIVSSVYDGILGILFKCRQSDVQFLIISCYLPPEDSTWGRDSNLFFSQLLSLVYSYAECDHIFICGDVNSRIANMKDFLLSVDNISDREILDEVKNAHGEALIDFLLETKMVVLNGRVTPQFNEFTSVSVKGKAVVDYILCPQTSLDIVKTFKVLLVKDLLDEYNLTQLLSERCRCPDHSVLLCTFHTSRYSELAELEERTVGSQNETGTTEMPNSSKRYMVNDTPPGFLTSIDFVEKLDEMISQLERCQNEQCELDRMYENFCKEMFKEMDKYFKYIDCSKKTRKQFKHYKPYWNDELTRMWQNMRAAEKHFLKCNRTHGNMRRHLHSDFKLKQRIFDKALRQTERVYYRNLADKLQSINSNDPKAFWKQIKKLGPSSKKGIPMAVYNDDGTLNVDIKSVLSKWSKDFKGILSRPTEDGEFRFDSEFCNDVQLQLADIEATMSNSGSESDYINSDFNIDEITKFVKKLKSGKACGPDFLPNEVIKQPQVTVLLQKLFQFCFNNGLVPQTWRRAIVVPIPKSALKDPHVPLNYRGISLLNCTSKLYSAIINHRLTHYCENNNYIVEEQNGFRSKRSCLEHLFTFTSIARNRLCEKKSTFVSFIDFHKAFDWVDRSLLFYKLCHNYNIRGKIYWAIKSMYNATASCIRLNEKYTEWFETSSGVKQGDNLSPTLFNLYINDLAQEIKNLNCGVNFGDNDNLSILLYADDIVLLAETDDDLQRMLNCLYRWCSKWRLVVNESKTKVMHIRPSRSPKTETKFRLGQTELDIVESYKYLGIFVDEHLNYNHTATLLSEAGSRALGALRNKIHNVKDIHLGTFTKLFNSGITPILDYCAGVWGFSNYKCLEDVQLKAARYFLGVHKLCPIAAIEGDIGWVKCSTRRKAEIINLWNHLVTLGDHRLPRRILRYDVELMNRNSNWSMDLVALLQAVNMDSDLTSFQQIDPDLVQKKLQMLQQNAWNDLRYQKIKLRNYNLFKGDMTAESYVSLSIKKSYRSYYAKFRMGILPLMIEVGRYYGIPLDERFCPICKDCFGNFIEDEFHFLCICSHYHDIRQQLYDQVKNCFPLFDRLESFEKFVYLNSNCQLQTSTFVAKAMQIRQSILYTSNLPPCN